MNSRRMPPGALTKAMRRFPNVPSTTAGPQMTSCPSSSASRSSVKRAGCRKPSAGSVHGVLVDGVGEERDHDGPEEDVGALAVVPVHAVADLGPGGLVERHRRVEVGHLDREVRHPRDRHRCPSRFVEHLQRTECASIETTVPRQQHYRLSPCSAPGPLLASGPGRRHLRVRPRPCPAPLPARPVDGRRGPDHGVPAGPRLSRSGRRRGERRRDRPRHGADRRVVDGRRHDAGGRGPFAGRESVLATLHRRLHAIAAPRLPPACAGRHRRLVSSTWTSIRSTS